MVFCRTKCETKGEKCIIKPGKPLVDYKQLTSRQFSRVRHKAPELFLASPQSVVRNSTTLQFLANQAGIVSIDNDKQTKQVQAGELVQFPVTLQKNIMTSPSTLTLMGIYQKSYTHRAG